MQSGWDPHFELCVEPVDGPLAGEIFVSGAKNATLPLLIAALYSDDEILLTNTAHVLDVANLLSLLNEIGCVMSWQGETTIAVTSTSIRSYDLGGVASFGLLRYSVLLMYPLLKRFGKARLPFPGGCQIERSLECHLKPLEMLGYHIESDEEGISIQEGTDTGYCVFELDSFRDDLVGMTESILFIAMGLNREIRIVGYAQEPEVFALVAFFCRMGVKIETTGTTLTIYGDKHFRGRFEHMVIPDRIEVATWMALMCVAPKQSHIVLRNIRIDHIQAAIRLFRQIGLEITEGEDACVHLRNHDKVFQAVSVVAENFPGLPTDVQPLVAAVSCFLPGSTLIDYVFPSRFEYIPEFVKAGAQISLVPSEHAKKPGLKVSMHGVISVEGELRFYCPDLRGGMAMLLLAVGCRQRARLLNAVQILRGYGNLVSRLGAVGLRLKEVPHHLEGVHQTDG